MPENITKPFSRIFIIKNLFNRLVKNTTRRTISVFEMSIKKIIDIATLFSFDDSAQ